MNAESGNNETETLLERGARTFESSLGASAKGFTQDLGAVAPGFGEMILEMEFGNAYHRPGLDLKTRELIIIATCSMLGTAGYGAAKMHIPAALRAGATRAEVVEVLVQIAFAGGLPTSIGALKTAQECFAELDAAAAHG